MSWKQASGKTARVEKASALNGIYLYTPYDASFIAQLKIIIPSELRLWEADEKRWYIFDSWADQAVALAKRYFPFLVDQREQRAYDEGYFERMRRQEQERRDNDQGFQRQRERQYQFFGQWQNGPSQGMTSAPSSDHAALCVTPEAPPEVIRAAYKALAMLNHPDKGGNMAKMQAVNAAYDRLKKAGKA